MSIDTTTTLQQAMEAGRFGQPVPQAVQDAIASGRLDLPLKSLGFDSLAWMEFCISIELNTGIELTPAEIAEMTSLAEIALRLEDGDAGR